MNLKVIEYIPRRCCTDGKLKKLRSAGFKTDGYENSMEEILTDEGFGVPVFCDEGFIFTINGKYTRVYLNYADALSSEILLLRDLKMIYPWQ